MRLVRLAPLLLLAAIFIIIIRARARSSAARPYWNCKDYSLLLLFFLYYYCFLGQNKCLFEGLNMHEKSWNLAHTSVPVKNLIFYGRRKRAWQNGSRAPPRKLEMASPSHQFDVNGLNSVGISRSSRRTKKSLEAISWVHQKVSHFVLNVAFLRVFYHFHASYFNELLLQFSSDRLQIWSASSRDLCDQKLFKKLCFDQTTLPWRRNEFRCFAIKQEVLITPTYITQSAPDFSCFITVPPQHIYISIFTYSHGA